MTLRSQLQVHTFWNSYQEMSATVILVFVTTARTQLCGEAGWETEFGSADADLPFLGICRARTMNPANREVLARAKGCFTCTGHTFRRSNGDQGIDRTNRHNEPRNNL